MSAKPLAIDLYAGLGGWASGLLAEGWRVIGFDIEAHVYGEHRYPAQLVIQDVLTLHGSQFRSADLIVASPPCQEYSYMAMPWTRAKQIAAALRATQFAAAEANELSAPPIRPMSVSGRADLRSSGGSESCDLCRAGVGKHGQPRRPDAHGPDAGGNPAKLGAPIERVEGPHPRFPGGYTGSRSIEELNRLFDACFRIQRQACASAGRHIPMVVENVRGAQPWVGRARWNFGSYYLWGDVPALMPPVYRSAQKVPGFRFDGSGGSFQSASVEQAGRKFNPDRRDHATKNNGGSWFDKALDERRREATAIKNRGDWFGAGEDCSLQRRAASGSTSRKFASAMIAKIPFELARHIARTFHPRPKSEAAA